jgi:protocatechuate 3,4-dioxygenase beta subunit
VLPQAPLDRIHSIRFRGRRNGHRIGRDQRPQLRAHAGGHRGAYYLPLHLVRSDITEGSEGLPLQLRLTVVNATTCKPIHGAVVDVWHADALGAYSGVAGASDTFLRGVQSTGTDGSPRSRRSIRAGTWAVRSTSK